MADHRHALTSEVLGVREEPPDIHVVLAHLGVIRGDADDRRVGVLVEVRDLQIARHLRLDREDLLAAVLQRVRVVHRELRRAGADLNAARARLAGVDRQERGAERRDAVVHLLLCASSERDHRDHRGDADDDAEHRQQRPQFVRAECAERDAEGFRDQHGTSSPFPVRGHHHQARCRPAGSHRPSSGRSVAWRVACRAAALSIATLSPSFRPSPRTSV